MPPRCRAARAQAQKEQGPLAPVERSQDTREPVPVLDGLEPLIVLTKRIEWRRPPRLVPPVQRCGPLGGSELYCREASSSVRPVSAAISSARAGRPRRPEMPLPPGSPCRIRLSGPRASGQPQVVPQVMADLAVDERHPRTGRGGAASGSKRDAALTAPTIATCSRSSRRSGPPAYRRATLRASGSSSRTQWSRAAEPGPATH